FLRLLVLAADIDLAGRIAADQYHRKPRREPVLPLHPRDFIGDAAAKLGSDTFSIDDSGRHLNPRPLPWSLVRSPDQSGFAAVSLRKTSPSLAGSPSTATCLRRDVVPDRMRTLAFGT